MAVVGKVITSSKRNADGSVSYTYKDGSSATYGGSSSKSSGSKSSGTKTTSSGGGGSTVTSTPKTVTTTDTHSRAKQTGTYNYGGKNYTTSTNAQTLLRSSKSLNNDDDDNNNNNYGSYSEYYGGIIPDSATVTIPKTNNKSTGVTLGSALRNAFANNVTPSSIYNEYTGTYDNNIQSIPATAQVKNNPTGVTLGSALKNAFANNVTNTPTYNEYIGTYDNQTSTITPVTAPTSAPVATPTEPTVVPKTPVVSTVPTVPEVPVVSTNVTDKNKPIIVNGVGDKTYNITKNSDKVKNILTGITDPEKLDKMMAWINIDNYMVGNTPITNAQNLYSADEDGSLALALRQQGFSDDEMNAIVAGMYEHYGTTKTAEKRISEGGTKSVEDFLAEIYNQNKANNQVNYNQTRSDVKNLLANSASNIDSQSAANRIAAFREMQNSTGPDQDIGLKYLASISTAGADAMNNRANLSDKEIELYNYINNAQNAGQDLDLSYLQTLANYAANKDYQATLGASNLAGVRYNANMNNYMNNNNLNAANQQTNASFSQLMQMINSGVNDPIQLIYKAMQSGLSYADAVALLTNYGVISST